MCDRVICLVCEEVSDAEDVATLGGCDNCGNNSSSDQWMNLD